MGLSRQDTIMAAVPMAMQCLGPAIRLHDDRRYRFSPAR
jgi:hypothetical protein